MRESPKNENLLFRRNEAMSCVVFGIIFSILSQIKCETSHSPKLLLISFDGFRADYVNSTLTPNLYKLSGNGVHAKHMKSVFITKTFPNHLSIVTGFYEETHGIIANEMFDPLLNATFNISKPSPEWWDNGLSKPIWLVNELHNDGKLRVSGSMMWPGSDTTFSGRLPKYLQTYNHSLNWEKRIDIVVNWLCDIHEPANFVALYFDEPDSTSHIHGPFSAQTYTQISRIDGIIGYLLSKLNTHRLLNSVNIIIVSDHGMAEIKRDNIIELNNFIDPNLYNMYGMSPVWNILPKTGEEEFVYNTLKNASDSNHFNVYKRENVPLQYHYRNHRRILSMVVVGDEGYEIVQKTPSNWNLSFKVWGNHGYNNSLPSMRPLFIAKGPAFKQNYVHETEFENIDLFPLMCFVLKLFPLKHSNGTLDRVYQMLVPISIQRRSYSVEKLFTAIFVVALGLVATICGGIILIVCLNTNRSSREVIDLSSEEEMKQSERPIRNDKKVRCKENAAVEETVLLLDSDGDESECNFIHTKNLLQ